VLAPLTNATTGPLREGPQRAVASTVSTTHYAGAKTGGEPLTVVAVTKGLNSCER